MSKRRRTKTLEKAARAIKDSDDFVEHVFSIARGYEAHHELDVGVGTRGVRQSLKIFDKHASQLAEWLKSAAQLGTPEHEALKAIRGALQDQGELSADVIATRGWLHAAARASVKLEGALQGKKLKNAPRFAADALRATFEHHKLKVSTQATEKKQGDAVKLLCAIAKDGGDPDLTAAQAREWLIASAQK